MPKSAISIVGLDKVTKGLDNIDKGLKGPVYDKAAKTMEVDLERSMRGSVTSRVKSATTTKTDKDGIEAIFKSATSKYSLDPLGNHFTKIIMANSAKYAKEIEDSTKEAFDG